MKTKLEILSDEQLQERLQKLKKNENLVNKLFIAVLILGAMLLLMGELSSSLGTIILVAILKFIIMPQSIGRMKLKIAKRNGTKQ